MITKQMVINYFGEDSIETIASIIAKDLNREHPTLKDDIINAWSSEESSFSQKSIYNEMGYYLSNDETDYDLILAWVSFYLKQEPTKRLDDVPTVIVWEKLEGKFTVEEFCNTIGFEGNSAYPKPQHDHPILSIIERKKNAQDCTEEESAEIKQFIKDRTLSINSWELGLFEDLEKLFPVEFDEALNEMED